MVLHLDQGVHHLVVGEDESHPPSGDGHHLGEAVDDDGALGAVHERYVLPFVDELAVDLVGEYGDVVLPCHVHEGVLGFLGEDTSGGVGGGVDDDHGRLRGDLGDYIPEVGLEGSVVGELVFDGDAPGEPDMGGVDHEPGAGDQDLVSGVDHALSDLQESGGAAGGDHHVVPSHLAVLGEVVGDGVPELRYPCGGAVLVLALSGCLAHSFDGLHGRGQVGFSQAEVDGIGACEVEHLPDTRHGYLGYPLRGLHGHP